LALADYLDDESRPFSVKSYSSIRQCCLTIEPRRAEQLRRWAVLKWERGTQSPALLQDWRGPVLRDCKAATL